MAVLSAPPGSEPALTAAAPSRRRDLATVLTGSWLITGLFVDGWAHNTFASELETFFTPWHALLYSGYVATAIVVSWPFLRAHGTFRQRVAALPVGYRLGFLGVLVFGLGGAGDSVWHTLLGIEVDLEALLSPPHLVLLTGALLILSSPARAAWRAHDEPAPGLRGFLPVALSVTLITALIGFFFMYQSGLYSWHPTAAYAAFWAAEAPDAPMMAEFGAVFGVTSRIVTTVILLAPLLLMLRRWRLPFGVVTLHLGAYAALLFALRLELPVMLVVAVLTGVVVDTLIRRLRGGPDDRRTLYAVAAALPAVLWSLNLGALAVVDRLAWSPEMWSGVVGMCTLTGLGLGLLVAPPAPQPAPGT